MSEAKYMLFDDFLNRERLCPNCRELCINEHLVFFRRNKYIVIMDCLRNRNHRTFLHILDLNRLKDFTLTFLYRGKISIISKYIPEDKEDKNGKEFDILGDCTMDEDKDNLPIPDFYNRNNNRDIIIIKVNGESISGNKFYFNPNVAYRIDIYFLDSPDSLEYIFFQNETLRKIENFEFREAHFKSVRGAFEQCNNLESIQGLSRLDVREVRNFESMFDMCVKLKSIEAITSWLPESAFNLRRMFYGTECLFDPSPAQVFKKSKGELDVWYMFSCSGARMCLHMGFWGSFGEGKLLNEMSEQGEDEFEVEGEEKGEL